MNKKEVLESPKNAQRIQFISHEMQWLIENKEIITIYAFEKESDIRRGTLDRFLKKGKTMKPENQKKVGDQVRKLYESLKKIYE